MNNAIERTTKNIAVPNLSPKKSPSYTPPTDALQGNSRYCAIPIGLPTEIQCSHKEGSKAFARYREIDKDIKREALSFFE